MTGGDVGLGPEGLKILFTGVLLGVVLGQIAEGTKELIVSKLIGVDGQGGARCGGVVGLPELLPSRAEGLINW